MDNEIKEMELEGGWSSWKIYVIKSLKRLETKQSELEKLQHESELEKVQKMTEIRTKMKMSSAFVSVIVTLIVGLIINVTSAFFIYSWIDDSFDSRPRNTIEQNIMDQEDN